LFQSDIDLEMNKQNIYATEAESNDSSTSNSSNESPDKRADEQDL
jgi:hypothetical protein